MIHRPACRMTLVAFLTFAAAHASHAEDWQKELDSLLPVLGHRNWIVIADSAYPSQTAPGITTIYAGGDQLTAVKHVLKVVDDAKHVRPVVHIDKELEFVPESEARGITQYRRRLDQALMRRKIEALPHGDIIQKLDEAGQAFHVLIIKTDLTLPYTSVFIRLDAGYWSDEAESKLRAAMNKEE